MVPFYAARVSYLGPGDLVQVDCICGHTERLTTAMLITAGVDPDYKVQDLGSRMRCRECDKKGRAVISIRWALMIGERPLPQIWYSPGSVISWR